MSNVQQLYPKEPAPIKCSFCGKLKTAVKHMWGNGDGKYICHICISKAKGIIDEENSSKLPTPA